MNRSLTILSMVGVLVSTPLARAQWPHLAGKPLRTSPIVVDADGEVYVANPDADSVTKLTAAANGTQTKVWEGGVGDYPRTVTLWGDFVLTANQNADTVSQLRQSDGSPVRTDVSLGFGCGPFGIVGDHAGTHLYVSCQTSQEVVVLGADLSIQARIKLDYPMPRAMAVSGNDERVYVTHFLTVEPGTDAHVSEIDTAASALTARRVLAIPADRSTCETQNSGQGVLNVVSSIVLTPPDAPAEVQNQLWVGGTLQNNLTKGLFRRYSAFRDKPEVALFDLPCPSDDSSVACLFRTFPRPANEGEPNESAGAAELKRNLYKSSFHDITRFVIWKVDLATGAVVGKLDVDEANHATDVAISDDGQVAYAVDQTFHSYHVFSTRRGQGTNPGTIFSGPPSNGPHGVDPSKPCTAEAIGSVESEVPHVIDPQAQVTPIDGGNPIRITGGVATPVDTGVDFDTRKYHETGAAEMRPVPDAAGTAPIGIVLSPDGCIAYVANYLSRNVVAYAARPGVAACSTAGQVADFRCTRDVQTSCQSRRNCSAVGGGFCGHPGGAPCAADPDCAPGTGPCVLANDCQPLVVVAPVTTTAIVSEEVPAEILDGKILFNTAARDGSVPNGIGLGSPAPLFNGIRRACSNDLGQACATDLECAPGTCVVASLPGEIVSTSHDASYVSCTSCHVDYGAQDGRTWDFAQFGGSLRNTMDLRGRSRFAPGTCKVGLSANLTKVGTACQFDAACGTGSKPGACGYDVGDDAKFPAHLDTPAKRANYFNPMLTVHWNGDRQEVEGFEFTYRMLLGGSDCDGNERDPGKCLGALVPRSTSISSAIIPDDGSLEGDLRSSLRNVMVFEPLLGKEVNASVRLSHMADFVYSLRDFPRNPNLGEGNAALSEAAQRGRAVFNDQSVACGQCHNGPSAQNQLFTDKGPNGGFDPAAAPGAASNNPYKRQSVGTANLFDLTDPAAVAAATGAYQNSTDAAVGKGIPGSRGGLVDYVTPVMNDAWNTPPFLHDGSAPTLLDVVRPCDTSTTDCNQKGLGRNIDDQHGKTAHLTPQQLNDLAAFEAAPHIPVSTSETGIHAGVFALTRATVKFGKRAGKGSFVLAGTAAAAGLPVDPATGGLAFTLAVPQGGQMVFRDVRGDAGAVKVSGGGKRIRFAADGISVQMKRSKRGDYAVNVKGKKQDLSLLNNGARDFTAAVVVGGTQFVDNQVLTPKKKGRVLVLKRRR